MSITSDPVDRFSFLTKTSPIAVAYGLPLIIQSLYRGHTKWSFREETRLSDRVLSELKKVKAFDIKFRAEVLGYRIVTRRGTILLEEGLS